MTGGSRKSDGRNPNSFGGKSRIRRPNSERKENDYKIRVSGKALRNSQRIRSKGLVGFRIRPANEWGILCVLFAFGLADFGLRMSFDNPCCQNLPAVRAHQMALGQQSRLNSRWDDNGRCRRQSQTENSAHRRAGFVEVVDVEWRRLPAMSHRLEAKGELRARRAACALRAGRRKRDDTERAAVARFDSSRTVA